MKYVPIFCEEKRRRDMAPRGLRGGRALVTTTVGKTYATKDSNGWHCACCKKPVRVVW